MNGIVPLCTNRGVHRLGGRQMKSFDRFFLFLYSITFLIVSLVALLVGVGFLQYNLLIELIEKIYFDYSFVLLGISIVTLFFSIYFLARSLQSKKGISTFRKRLEIGEVQISMESLETLVTRVSSKVKGVRELKARVKPEENGTITILVKVFVDGETPMPLITEEIQQQVKENIEHISGITVGQVHVMISNISQNTVRKPRVE